jgi:hypothetical protein
MSGVAAFRNTGMPVQVAPLGEPARRLLFYIFVSIVYLAMFGIRVLPDFSVSFSLVAVYGLCVWLLVKGQASFDIPSIFLFSSILLLGCAAVFANSGGYFSLPSLLLLAVLYLPFTLSISPGPHAEHLRRHGLKYFCDLSLGLAVCAIVQYALQYVLHASWLFNLGSFVPDWFSASGVWNHAVPINGSFKANGLFQREPSGLSMLLGLAVVVEMTGARRYPRLAVMALAMALSYSGTGILIAAAGLLLPTNGPALRRTLILLAVGVVFWFVFKTLLNLDVFLDRATEFDKPNTSGYARFVAPLDVVKYGFGSSWWAPYIGNGPGTIQPAIIRYTTTYAIHDPTWAKLLFEYGILGFGVMVAFATGMVRRSAAPIELKIALFYTWFAAGGMLLNPDMLALLFGLSALWRAPSLLPVQAAPQRFPMARAA